MLPRWLISFRALALAATFAAAFVPLVTYITDDKRDWLWVHIGVNIAAYIAVALTTIYTTASLMQQDHNKYRVPAYWANNVIMRTWYLGVSKTWRWHVAAAVGRLGLALALAQHIVVTYSSWPHEGLLSVLNPFIYMNYNTLDYEAYRYAVGYSQWETALIGLCFIVSLSILEASFLSSFSLIAKYIRPQCAGSRILVLRLILSALIILMMFIVRVSTLNDAFYTDTGRPYYRNPGFGGRVTVLEEWHKVAFTWLDNGVMLAAWTARPVTVKGNYACTNSEPDRNNLDGFCTAYDNKLFVFTDILAAIAAYATYILAIVATLQLAHYLHWRRERHAAPTPLSP